MITTMQVVKSGETLASVTRTGNKWMLDYRLETPSRKSPNGTSIEAVTSFFKVGSPALRRRIREVFPNATIKAKRVRKTARRQAA